MGLIDRRQPRIEQFVRPSDTVDCTGCGRKINVEGIPFRQWFICRKCKRTMRLTGRRFTFQYTPAYQRRKRIYTLITGALICLWSLYLALDLVYPDGPAHWLPGLRGIAGEGVGLGHPVPILSLLTLSGLCIAVYLYVAREKTEDYRLIGGGMVLLFAARRVPLWHLCRLYGHPKTWVVLAPAGVAGIFGVSFLLLSWWKRRHLPMI